MAERIAIFFTGAIITLIFPFHACQPPSTNLRNIEEKHTTKLGTIRQIVRLLKGDNRELCQGNS